MDDFSLYIKCKRPEDALDISKTVGNDFFFNIRMLRYVFKLDLISAKEAIIKYNGEAKDIVQYQSKLVDPLMRAIEEDNS